MGFGQGLSGLNASSQNLDVIGNNIANSGTVGFKAGSATFSDVYANSRVGLGVQLASINQRFTTGTVSTTGNQFDMAIDGTKGLFVVQQPNGGAILYTRNGQFFADKDSNIVNAQGQQLLGYRADTTVTPPRPILGTQIGLTVPLGNMPPKASTTIADKLNLDAGASIIAAPVPTPDLTDSSTYSNSFPTTIYDSLGVAHRIDQVYQKTGDNTWNVTYLWDDGTGPQSVGSASLKFTTAGALDTANSTAGTIGFNPPGADAIAMSVSYDGSTQFNSGYTSNFTQDGYASGEYASTSIGTDGAVIANYTNGAKQVMGFVALADFNNLQGLQPVGGNAWAETANSGQPLLGTPGVNGMAAIKGQAIEESNVDMSQELVNMIIAQRTYQANAQTIKTQDQILQTLITMR
ncbi:flagellar hook protein FlgE [Castellaniella caeni]|uniref:flagellar hook protein FlgE n=1 Tax=Castellaniella caeni TaxID=266123 RepID=UPI00082DC20C|nr:flagellar hook protein FlgE [Castellaniella caeni]